MPSPLVGRLAELGELEEALGTVTAGRPATVLIGGEPGLGKTRLLAEFLDRARARGTLVLQAACLDLGGGDLPYLPLQELLRTLVRDRGAATIREWAGPCWPELARLLPALAGKAPEVFASLPREGNRARLMEAVLRVVEECAAQAPTVLAVEDLHWIDQSTGDLLLFLRRGFIDHRVLLVGTYRPGESARLRRMVTGLGGRRRELAPLSPAEIRELVDGLVPNDSAFAAEVARRSDGNAFFANELVAAGADARSSVPVGVRDVVLARLDAAGPQARNVAGTIAAAGRPVPHPLLEAAAPVSRVELLAVLRECVHAHLLAVDADDRYAFRHALALEAVYGDLLPGERSAHHRALAETLAAQPALRLPEAAAAAAELAHHWDLGGDLGSALAMSAAAGAAAAAVFGYAEAERQYDRALRLLPAVPDSGLDSTDILMKAADAARWVGHMERAVELIERALVESAAPVLHERHGRYLWELGRTDESLEAYGRACAAFSAGLPSKEGVWVLGGYATALMQAGRLHEAVARCREALRAADNVGVTTEAGRARTTLGAALTSLGFPEEGIAELRVAVAVAEAAGSPEELMRSYTTLGIALETAGRYEESLAATQEGVRRSRDLGLEAADGPLLLANAASILMTLGRWDEAEEVADAARRRGTPVAFDHYRQIVLAEIDIGRGRFIVAADRLARAGSAARLQEPQFAGLLYALRAEAQLWQGRPESALAAVEQGVAAVAGGEDKAPVLRLCALGLRAEADRAQRRRALPQRARNGADEPKSAFYPVALAAAADPLLPAPTALWELCQAEHARASGSEAQDAWASVARRWDALSQPYPAAYARWRAGESAVDRGDRSAAAAVLRRARRAATALGATPLLVAVDALAAAARIVLRDAAAAQNQPVTAVPFGLTPREREVLALLCDGMTNRQIARALFVTDRTAAVHVSNIIAKLQVANRGQAAAIARRTGLMQKR